MQMPCFSDQTEALLSRAESFCDRRGTRLTELRRHVLGLVLEADRPAGAYDLLDRLRAHHKGAAPPTIYRALDFLLDHGLIHKLERLSAYVGCAHAVEADGHDHPHAAQFLICTRCRRVIELTDGAIRASLVRAAGASGFTLHHATIEAEGLCDLCSEAVLPPLGPA